MKRFMTTTAIALTLATGAFAEAHISAPEKFEASDLLGMRVYAENPDTAVSQWDNIGDIKELLITMDGNVPQAIVGVGGFIGIGEKDVALALDQLKMTTGEDGAQFLTVAATAEQLEQMAAYVSDDASADTAMATDTPVTATETADMAATDPMTTAPMMLTPPMVERDGYSAVAVTDLSAEELTGARVYGPGDEDIGEVSEVILAADGSPSQVTIDVGGFLGIGEKTVALTFDELSLLRETDGDDLRVYIDSTEDQLKALPEYQM